MLNDTRYQTKKDRVEHHVTLFDELSPYFKKYSTDEMWNLLDGAGIPAGPVLNHVEVLKNPQTIARGMVEHVKHPKLGVMKTLGAPVKLSKTPAQVPINLLLEMKIIDQLQVNIRILEQPLFTVAVMKYKEILWQKLF